MASSKVFADVSRGNPAGPTNPGNFGMSTNNLSFPGTIGSQTYGFGLPENMAPESTIELEGRVTLTGTYVSPDLPEMADLQLAPQMPVMAIREKIDVEDGPSGLTIVASIPQINLLAANQWSDFVRGTTGDERTNPYFDERAKDFLDMMRRYGESGLETYAQAYAKNNRALMQQLDNKCPTLRDFFQMSTEDGFCYLTTYGFLQKVSFLGVILSTNRADSGYDNETAAATQNLTTLAVAFGQRAECAQIFGPNTEAVKGSMVYLALTRCKCGPDYKPGTYGRFMIKAMSSPKYDYLPSRCISFLDESGKLRPGHVWNVGTILEPAEREPSREAQELAQGLAGTSSAAQRAFDAYGYIPSFILALGI